jgi:desulfoferrodoxin (superoxide reductase-like protein)
LNINLQFENDGDRVVNLGSVPFERGSAMVTAKTKSVHMTEGENILNYTTRPIIRGDGCIAQNSFAIGRETAFMLGEKGVFSTSNIGVLNDPLPISRIIQPDIDALTDAERAAACGAVFEDKYFLVVGGRMWYYDIEASMRQNKHVWIDMQYEQINFNVLEVIDNVLYGGDDAQGQVHQLFTGNQDDSDNIELIVTSGEVSLPRRPHMFIDRVEIMVEKETSTVMNFQYALDGGSLGAVESKTIDQDNSRYVFNVNERCYSFKYKITETGSNEAARVILPLRIFFKYSETGEDGTKG